MSPQHEKVRKPMYYLPKDEVGELLEDTVRLVLEGLQPVSLCRRIGDLVNTGLTTMEVFHDLPKIVMEELPVTRVALMKKVSGNKLEIIAAHDRWENGPPQVKGWRPQDRIPIRGNGKSPFAKAWRAEKIWVEDVPSERDEAPQRFVGVPFFIQESERGILCFLSTRDRPVESHHFALWGLLSNQISLVLRTISTLHGQRIWNQLLEDRVRERTRALQASEAKYRALVENMADTIFTVSKKGKFTFVSPQAEPLAGYSLDKLLQMTYSDLVDSGDTSFAERQITKVVAGEHVGPFEISIRNAAGRKVYLEVNISATRDERGEIVGFQGIARDITEREQLKRQLQHAQKMEAVGTLAGGMAHEFNNILAAIQGYTQLITINLGSENPVAGYVSNIEVSCQRAAGLTRKILTFSRLENRNELPVKLNRVVDEVQQLLRQTLSPQIELESELDPGLPFVLADPAQLEQVLLNLGVNARDGMPDGGVVRFETRLIHLDNGFCRKHPWASPGRYIEVVVKDTGKGMPPEVLERIFDPFFTTKEPGKGTGLGLSIAYSIVKNHRGYILAESRVGHGSCFRVYLPAFEEITEDVSEPPREEPVFRGNGESVLVVDDEPQFREVVRSMLESSGYRVTLAAHGEEAISIYEEAKRLGEEFDLIILDLAMPKMSGEAYLERLLEMDPHSKVLIATGFGEEHLRSDAIRLKAKGILFKPFDLNLLLREVHHTLET
jgi:PAS domain S-box-containing protein